MYDALLWLHSWNRWVLLLLTLGVIGLALRALPQRSVPKGPALAWLISADLQLLLGLMVYGLSPYLHQLRSVGMGTAMKTPSLRFWVVEHAVMALLSLVLVHVAFKAVKKGASPKKVLWLAVAALVLMCAAVPWPFLAHGRALFRI